jgi:hypothetical protein
MPGGSSASCRILLIWFFKVFSASPISLTEV